jgi:transglutaminase-like putative cysteine protease
MYLSAGDYVDSDHPAVRALAADFARLPTDSAKACALYYVVRDSIGYQTTPALGGSMAEFLRDPETYRASSVLATGVGYCASKASLLTALCRAAGIPARVAFADVLNRHHSARRIRRAMGTDVFAWHGYSEILLGGRWVRVTPMFTSGLSRRMGVDPVEFDGYHDALLQSEDRSGRPMFSYVAYHGSFADVPVAFLTADISRRYPGLKDYRALAVPLRARLSRRL